MKLSVFKAIAAVAVCLSLLACTTTRKLTDLAPGMTTAEVIELLGEPEIAREPLTNKYGQLIELWHYEIYNSHVDAHEPYFLYFYEGKLGQWGKATHLPREKAYEINFEPQ